MAFISTRKLREELKLTKEEVSFLKSNQFTSYEAYKNKSDLPLNPDIKKLYYVADDNISLSNNGLYYYQNSYKKVSINNDFFVFNVIFIKELWVDGWNSGDLYLTRFTNDDNGKVTIQFRTTDETRVIFTFQQDLNQEIYSLDNAGDASGSGYSGYVVIDWSKYTTAINSIGFSNYAHQVDEKAKLIQNSPYIKAYLQSISDRAYTDTAESNSNSYTHTKKVEAQTYADNQDVKKLYEANRVINQQVFESSANHSNIENLKKFILDIKAKARFVDNVNYYLSSVARLTSNTEDPNYNLLRFQIRQEDDVRVMYSSGFEIKNEGIEKLTLISGDYTAVVSVDWSAFTTLTGAVDFTETQLYNGSFLSSNKSFLDLTLVEQKELKIQNIYENWNNNLATIPFNFDETHATTTPTYVQNQGITIDIDNYGDDGFLRLKGIEKYNFKPHDYVAVKVKYKINSENMTDGVQNIPGENDVFGNNGAGFRVGFEISGIGTHGDFGGSFMTGHYREATRLMKFPTNAQTSNQYNLYIQTKMTALEDKGIDVNYTISELTIYPLGNEDVPKDKAFFESLNEINFDYFLESLNNKEISDTKETEEFYKHAMTATNVTNYYTGKALFVYSASVWETQWQAKMIAARTGMIFDETIARDGRDGYSETTFGGAQLTPVLVGTRSKNAGENHFARIVETWEYYVNNYGSPKGNVVILPFGFNHPGVDGNGDMKPFISGGVAKESIDFGIDFETNPPYTDYVNFERDLVADNTIPNITYDVNGNPTNNGVASYGSYLRGIVEFILSKDPFCQIFIPTTYYASGWGGVGRVSTNNRNAVNIQVAREYGFTAPRVDLMVGLNQYTKHLLKDVVHPERFVGYRSALAVLTSMGAN